jgi:hypothetical protein
MHTGFRPSVRRCAQRIEPEGTMHTKQTDARAFWKTTRLAVLRALLWGPAAAAIGAAFCAIAGAAMCLADGLPWSFAGLCALRGAFAGVAAGAIMGAMSGVFHYEDPRPAVEKVESCNPELANCNPAPPRPSGPISRNNKVHSRLG